MEVYFCLFSFLKISELKQNNSVYIAFCIETFGKG